MYKLDFLEALRKKIENKSVDELKEVVTYLAKQLPSGLYVEVLSWFELDEEKVEKVAKLETATLFAEIAKLHDAIEEGGYSFRWHFDNYYHDYYDDDSDDELIDENGLGRTLGVLFQKVMKIAHNDQYAEAYELFNQLFSISVYDDDYGNEITVEELFEHDLISIPYVDTIYLHAHCVLMSKHGTERARALFNIISTHYYNYEDFMLEDVMKIGAKPIPAEDEFYQEWINYLKNHPADEFRMRDAFLIDALTHSGGIGALQRFVNENGMLYANVVFKLLQLNIQTENFVQAVDTIKSGFKELNSVDGNRRKLADYLIEIAKKLDDKSYLKEGIIEGFKSSLRLKYYGEIHAWQDVELIRELLEYLEIHWSKESGLSTKFDYYCIQFLNGNYNQFWNECAKDLDLLGWSSSLKGILFPLFLAMLTKGELGKITSILVEQLGKQLDCHGLIDILTLSTKELPNEEHREYLKWCENQVKLRVEAIVGGKKRGAYERASQLIVAMGEVFMSIEGEHAGINYIHKFKLAYPRHNAFQKCLREDLLLIEKQF